MTLQEEDTVIKALTLRLILQVEELVGNKNEQAHYLHEVAERLQEKANELWGITE